jgi:hypothetical protein
MLQTKVCQKEEEEVETYLFIVADNHFIDFFSRTNPGGGERFKGRDVDP